MRHANLIPAADGGTPEEQVKVELPSGKIVYLAEREYSEEAGGIQCGGVEVDR